MILALRKEKPGNPMSSYFFDIDTDLKQEQKFQSNKRNQEFEYFIMYCAKTLHSEKQYQLSYLKKIAGLTGSHPVITVRKDAAESFVYDHGNPLNGHYNDKKNCEWINENILHKKIYKVNDLAGERFLLKPRHSFSGIGILKSWVHEKKISQLTSFSDWVAEPHRARILDFSTLFLNCDLGISYETIVDNHFQFKGMRFNTLELEAKHQEQYENEINKVRSYLGKKVSYPFSIDSYLYLESDEVKLWSLCEINMRKTMSYFAYQCAQFFNSSEICGFYILPQNKKIKLDESMIKLDPGDTKFATFLVRAESKKMLLEKERELFF
jgi:hypothetical protein